MECERDIRSSLLIDSMFLLLEWRRVHSFYTTAVQVSTNLPPAFFIKWQKQQQQQRTTSKSIMTKYCAREISRKNKKKKGNMLYIGKLMGTGNLSICLCVLESPRKMSFFTIFSRLWELHLASGIFLIILNGNTLDFLFIKELLHGAGCKFRAFLYL